MKQLSELVLASGSPRRTELLNQMGIRHTVVVTDVDERVAEGESPEQHVTRLACEKAVAGLKQSGCICPALGADTIVLLEGEILGKPRDRRHARQMLTQLSGVVHQVLSAVALACPDGQVKHALSVTDVSFAKMPEVFLDQYSLGSDPMDKAGAYAVQGETARFISRIEGSYSGVMGLPLFETGRLLQTCGVIE